MMNDRGLDGYRGDLSRRCVTIAEVLRPAGYRTYMAGKWHVTKQICPASESDKHNWPRQRGFDRFYGTIHGGGSFFDPNTLTRDNAYISPHADSEYTPKEFYYTDAISDHAVRFAASTRATMGSSRSSCRTTAAAPRPWAAAAVERGRDHRRRPSRR